MKGLDVTRSAIESDERARKDDAKPRLCGCNRFRCHARARAEGAEDGLEEPYRPVDRGTVSTRRSTSRPTDNMADAIVGLEGTADRPGSRSRLRRRRRDECKEMHHDVLEHHGRPHP